MDILKELINNECVLSYYKEVIQKAYEIDDGFPFSCDYIVLKMNSFLNKLKHQDLYCFEYIRGHYHDTKVEQACCISLTIDFKNCKNCSCDVFRQHSYILVVDKVGNHIGILDFASYQFNSDFFYWLSNSYQLSKEEIVDYIIKNNEIIVEKEKIQNYENIN